MTKNITAAIIFSIGFMLFFVLALPVYDSLGAMRTIINAKKILLDERNKEVTNFNTFGQQAKAHQADISKIAVVLPAQKQIDELVSSISTIAATSGMQLSDMSIAAVTASDLTNYRKIFININFVGQYASLSNMLKAFERNLRLFDINEISAAESTGSAGGINFVIKMYAYYLK